MATIKDVLEIERIYETVKCTKQLLAKLEDNPKWEDTFEKEVAEFKKKHSDAECVALQAALSSHVFLTCGNEISALPISDDQVARRISTCDLNEKNFPVKVIPFHF